MASFTLNIPDDKVAEVLDAFADAYDYASVSGMQNPPTKAQFAKSKIKDYVRAIYKNYKRNQAMETAADAVNNQIITDAGTITLD